MRLQWQEEPNAPPPPHSASAPQSPPARGSLYPSPFAATQVGWCEPGAQRVSHTLAPFTVLNGPQRPGVCLRGRLGCHLARTRGGNQPFIRLGFNTIHFIFPTTENWIKAARVVGGVRRSGGGGQPSPWPTHHPHLWKAGSPNPPRVGGRLGWDGGWTISPGTRLIWVRNWLWGGYRKYRTQALANCPHQKSWGASL